MTKAQQADGSGNWLLLVHQLPPKPAYLRVKVWRRLQSIGAIALKNSVYALPRNEQTREDFQWLLRDIEQNGGEGLVCEAKLADGMRDDEVRALFDRARDADYDALAKDVRALLRTVKRKKSADEGHGAQIAKLRQRFAEINQIDFFGATGRMTLEGLFAELEHALIARTEKSARKSARPVVNPLTLAGKIWVTRNGVHVDRIACAWLVRRFIDPKARFKFVAGKEYAAGPGEVRFDMLNAEFTHEGDKCSFEVLLERMGMADKALQAIAEIVHDIDLKDNKFARAETAGIAHVIAGICMTHSDDEVRIARGTALFDDTYERYRRRGAKSP